MQEDKNLSRQALHEAAHAYMCIYLGVDIQSVQIIGPNYCSHGSASPLRVAMIALAGSRAEQIYFNHPEDEFDALDLNCAHEYIDPEDVQPLSDFVGVLIKRRLGHLLALAKQLECKKIMSGKECKDFLFSWKE